MEKLAGFENLPKEILAIILGRLSFADLIMMKNVCRQFNILCRPILMRRLQFYSMSDSYDNMIRININIFTLCDQIDSLRRYTNPSYREFAKNLDLNYSPYLENIWLFMMANYETFNFVDEVLLDLIYRSILSKNISETMKMFYVRQYCNVDRNSNILKKYVDLWNVLKNGYWQIDKLDFLVKILEMAKDDFSYKVFARMLGDLKKVNKKMDSDTRAAFNSIIDSFL